jgi:2-iminobutanoate/2-iminopropanoate deaminase
VTNGMDSTQAIMPSTLPSGPAERTVYSYGVRAGNTLYISGMVAFTSDGTIVGEGDIAAQAEQVFENLKAVVEAAGGNLDNVVATTTYLTDVSTAQVVNQARAKYFTGPVKPTHTVVGVAALARPQFLVEISGVAVLP